MLKWALGLALSAGLGGLLAFGGFGVVAVVGRFFFVFCALGLFVLVTVAVLVGPRRPGTAD